MTEDVQLARDLTMALVAVPNFGGEVRILLRRATAVSVRARTAGLACGCRRARQKEGKR
ncbi:hypothetical protein SSP35_09_02170 [Streptomyces sp. NBRC 110611]|nr:hypothetical protein SSP35_09_02170 [Streptomyces sp. NBRC 110611]